VKFSKGELIAIVSGDCCGSTYEGMYRALVDFEATYIEEEVELVTCASKPVQFICNLLDSGCVGVVGCSKLYLYENRSCGIPLVIGES